MTDRKDKLAFDRLHAMYAALYLSHQETLEALERATAELLAERKSLDEAFPEAHETHPILRRIEELDEVIADCEAAIRAARGE